MLKVQVLTCIVIVCTANSATIVYFDAYIILLGASSKLIQHRVYTGLVIKVYHTVSFDIFTHEQCVKTPS